MKRDPTILLIAAAFAVLLCASFTDTLLYLMRGYSLGVSIQGGKPSIYHIDFPPHRVFAHLALWTLGLVAVALFAVNSRHARLLSWCLFCAALIVGVWDIIQYGTMGAPTSLSALLLLLLLAIATQFRDRIARRSV